MRISVVGGLRSRRGPWPLTPNWEVQPRVGYEEKIDLPFFFLQESHALGRFCMVDIAVVTKDFDYALVAAAGRWAADGLARRSVVSNVTLDPAATCQENRLSISKHPPSTPLTCFSMSTYVLRTFFSLVLR